MMKKEMEEEEDLGFGDDGDFEIYNNGRKAVTQRI
jgi:hypothetical protein